MNILLLIILAASSSFAQEAKKESLPCSCSYSVNVRYPDIAEEDELEGTVIVEYDIDSVCFASNPRIIQSLGPVYDKEALRVVNLTIAGNNKCVAKCKYSYCEKRKVKFPMTFKKSENLD